MTTPTTAEAINETTATSANTGKPGVIACPSCGSTNITLDWDATVSLRVVDGVVQYVLVGGILGVRPDNLYCEDCNDQPVGEDEATDAAITAAEDTLPGSIAGDLNNGWHMYGEPSAG